MKAAATDITKEMTPVAQVKRRFPLQAAMKNLPHRWITMKKKKRLDTPQVEGVDEVSGGRHVPPAGAHDGEHATCDDDPGQAHYRQDAEHVDPRGHVGRLAVRQDALGGEG